MVKFGVVFGVGDDGELGWNCLNVFYIVVSWVGGLDFGFFFGEGGMMINEMVLVV